jgi:selenocysteine lyase/cysteine desulfurase
MALDRRQFLKSAAVTAGVAVLPAAGLAAEAGPAAALAADWAAVRRLFVLSPGIVHLSAMLIASHPEPVRLAISRYRDALDVDPATYLADNDERLTDAVVAEAANYLDTNPRAVALTDSTTQGVGLAYGGLRLEPGDEILTTEEDYYVTHESLRLVAQRSGALLKRIPLYDDIASVSAGELVETILRAVTPETRLIALTWVHSSTGLKLPVAEIAARLSTINARRERGKEVLLGIDGVHGFGVEDVGFDELGCDFFMAGCHKWLFGPRGTGLLVASERGFAASLPIVPTFLDSNVFLAWLRHGEPDAVRDGATLSPGGFKAFEHRWALAEAFRLHAQIGKGRVMARTHELAAELKRGLRALGHVTLITPISSALAAGIVSFDVDGFSTKGAVDALREKGVVASAAPYATPHVRLTPSITNSDADIDAALAAVAALG